jgi:hypothetical protein
MEEFIEYILQFENLKQQQISFKKSKATFFYILLKKAVSKVRQPLKNTNDEKKLSH